MIKDLIEKGLISKLSGIAQYKNRKEIYVGKNKTIEIISADAAILRSYLKSGPLVWSKSYKNYMLDGKCIYFDINKNKQETNYKAGKKDGKCKTWRGSYIFAEANYKEGRLHGKAIMYIAPKKPGQIDYYKDGKWIGVECYGLKGKLLSKYFKE